MTSTLNQLQQTINEVCKEVPATITVPSEQSKKDIGKVEVNWNFHPTSSKELTHWSNVVPLKHPKWGEIEKLFARIRKEHGQAVLAREGKPWPPL